MHAVTRVKMVSSSVPCYALATGYKLEGQEWRQQTAEWLQWDSWGYQLVQIK